MKFIINFEKKHFWALAAVLVVVGIGIVIAANVDTTKPWHVLQQVAKNSSDMSSVDSNGDGVIDISENAMSLNPISGCNSGQVLKWDGANWVCQDDNVGGAIGPGASGVIICKKTGTGVATGENIKTFTATDCGGTLPDASHVGVAKAVKVNNGQINFRVLDDVDAQYPGVWFWANLGGSALNFNVEVVYLKKDLVALGGGGGSGSGGSNFDFSVAGQQTSVLIEGNIVDDNSIVSVVTLPNTPASVEGAVVNFFTQATGDGQECTDTSIQVFTMNDVFIGQALAANGAGADIQSQGSTMIVPVTAGQFKVKAFKMENNDECNLDIVKIAHITNGGGSGGGMTIAGGCSQAATNANCDGTPGQFLWGVGTDDGCQAGYTKLLLHDATSSADYGNWICVTQGSGSGSPSSLLCSNAQSLAGGPSQVPACVSAAADGGLGDGTWRIVNCKRTSNDIVGELMRYNSGKWQWYRSDWNDCVDGSAMITKIG